MQASSAGTPELAGHLDLQVRAQERQLVAVRLAVVALALGFLITFGEAVENRFALMGVVAWIAAYSFLIGRLAIRFPIRPVAVLGVTLDALAVTAIVWLATDVPDAYLFYAIVILGVAIRFGMIASVAAALVIGATYLVVVYGTPVLNERMGEFVPVRVLFLVIFGVVAGLFSRIIIGVAGENARLQRRLEAEEHERERGRERELLSRLSRDFGASLQWEATLRAIVAGSAPLLGDATLLLTLDPDKRQLTPVAAEGRDPTLAAGWFERAEARRPRVGKGIVGIAAGTGTPWLGHTANVKLDPDGLHELGLDWVLATPVQAGGRLLGVLATGGPGVAADDHMRRMAEALADRAGPALQNAQLWADLQEQVAREQQAQRVKDDFLSVVSHELRTPLTSIQGYSQLLEARLRADRGSSKEMAHVGVILSQVLRMRRLVDDLLDVTRIDRRWGVTIEPADFDLADLLRDAVSRISRAEPERAISLEAPDSLPVHLDRERIDQVLSNLLENAVKYSPHGGPIGVAVEVKGRAFELRVSDIGVGVSAEQREHVFASFYQAADGEGRRRVGGLGLGLAISRAIVEAHGGKIWVEANEVAGRGSIFAMRLPRTAVPLEQIRPDERDGPPRFMRRRTDR
ncbi:MAG: ATP-binding protein [Candidatus Limnocylindria bacterium]